MNLNEYENHRFLPDIQRELGPNRVITTVFVIAPGEHVFHGVKLTLSGWKTKPCGL